jgi:glycosyltransferase involved in cell wall biosynthesis
VPGAANGVLRVVILSKALIVGAYQRKLEEIARLGIDLTVLVPPSWREPRVGEINLERRYTAGYRLEAIPIALNGRHHIHFYPGLERLLQRLRPDVLHIDEESFNLATYQAMRCGVRLGARCCFYNYANIDRRYPPPFSFFEHYNLTHANHAFAANREASDIIRRHGYRGHVTILPQVGVDPDLFAPDPAPSPSGTTFVVGYLGRLVREKGLLDLIDAVAGLPEHVRLHLVGDGHLRAQIEERAVAGGIAGRLRIASAVPSMEVPATLRSFDLLVLPSRTTPNWKEQFGRVLVEAMSCGVPVVATRSGEIPHVVGDAGVLVPEGDRTALRDAIARIASDAALRDDLRQRGRAHVLSRYTQAAIARRYVAVYQAMR